MLRIQSLYSYDFNTIVDARRACIVLYDKLRHQYQGRCCNEANDGHSKALSIVQESALGLYVDRCEELGRPCKHKHIKRAANSLRLASSSL
jgi:hypothetical protein